MDLDVLFEDDHLIVLNKPAGLTVHPRGQQGRHPGEQPAAPLSGLPGISGKLRPGIVHRLDKDTTGTIVIAKSRGPGAAAGADQGTDRLPRVLRRRPWGAWW